MSINGHHLSYWESKTSSLWRTKNTHYTRETCISSLSPPPLYDGPWSPKPSTILRTLTILMNFYEALQTHFQTLSSMAMFLGEFLGGISRADQTSSLTLVNSKEHVTCLRKKHQLLSFFPFQNSSVLRTGKQPTHLKGYYSLIRLLINN